MEIRIVLTKTEYLQNPLGIDALQPRLFWAMESERRAVAQTAYQILVATSEKGLERDEADMWDSGKVISGRSVHVVYEGKPLQSRQTYYWKVRVWDQDDRVSAWSEPAFWSMGLLAPGEWKAAWIGTNLKQKTELPPCPFVRKEVPVRATVRRAIAYATALGLYELHINGERLGDWFAPGWTDYHTRVQYRAYDITEKLVPGANAFGAVLGGGWYCGVVGMFGKGVYGSRPYFLMQVHIEYEDGTEDVITTDASWKTVTGPLLYSDFIKGETYDARLELSGWSLPGYNDSAWSWPEIKSDYTGRLVAQVEPPIRIMQHVKPVDVRKTAQGTYLYDMGQNMVGWTELTVKGEAGTTVELSYAEMLNPDGTLYTENLRRAVQKDTYILQGHGMERYEPHFTFHGFRYVELIGYPGEPDLHTIVGKVVHSDTPLSGSLQTSNERVNRLYSNITWGQRGNFISVPTDCPQRDERLGWTGDAQIFARTAAYNMDVSRFFSKYMIDVTDAQLPTGAFPDVAPDAGWVHFKTNTRLKWMAPDNAGWGDAGVIIPWTMYLMYGDERILRTTYDAVVRWIDYLEGSSNKLIRPAHADYGDWLSIDADTPKDVLATAYFAYSTMLASEIAGILGEQGDAERFARLYQDIRTAFAGAFIDEEGRIKGDTQTVYVLALQFRLLSGERAAQAVKHLTDDIRRRGNRLSTGFLGVGYLLPALTDAGCLDTAYALLTQEAFPSWMYSIVHGATTIWERWDGWTLEKGFQTPSMNSFNHYSLGSVGEWMFRYMAGIEADPGKPGFQHVVIHPNPGGSLTFVNASYKSLYGTIESEWHREESGGLRLLVSIPANTTATVFIPDGEITVDGLRLQPGAKGDGCQFTEIREGKAVLHIGSGKYELRSKGWSH